MCNRTKLGLNILEAALLLGVLGDALLRETPWGLNVLLWTGALVAAMAVLQGRRGRREASWRGDGGWLLLPICFFAAAFAWRDSSTLNFLDGLALCVAFALLAWRARGHSIRLAGLSDYASGLGHAAVNAMFASLPLVINDVQWHTIPRTGVMRHMWAAARGLLIAVPLLVLFGAFFMAADAVFEGIMLHTFQIDSGVMFSHLFLMLLFAWLTGGFLRGMMLADDAQGVTPDAAAPAVYTSITIDKRETSTAGTDATRASESHETQRQPPSIVDDGATASGSSVNGSVVTGGVDDARAQEVCGQALPGSNKFSLGAVEVGIVLGMLNVLFACFVVVQIRYFFGGAAWVMSITELTYAEYARRGFFELTWVAGLTLTLLLITYAVVRTDRPAAQRLFRCLAGTQIALLFVIMASAIARMRLYQSEYGLTELRLYTTAFMFWLGLVFVWFAWTVLVVGARERFACGALVAAFAVLGLLHLLNPDAYIVRANAGHARAGRAFDAQYAASLSADAVPALVSALPALSREERCHVARAVSYRWSHPAAAPGEDWRAWNLARSRARRMVAAHESSLSRETCPPPQGDVPAMNVTSASETIPPATPSPANAAISTAPTAPHNHAMMNMTTAAAAAAPGSINKSLRITPLAGDKKAGTVKPMRDKKRKKTR
ncbi:MAG: DUF4153 domain-containing protein [Pyrinomonadaceae bacterium]